MGGLMLNDLMVDNLVHHISRTNDMLSFGRTCKKFNSKMRENSVWIPKILRIEDDDIRKATADILPRLKQGHAIYFYFLTTNMFTCRECKKKYTIQTNKKNCKIWIHPGSCVNWYYTCCNDYGDGCTPISVYHNARIFDTPPKWDISRPNDFWARFTDESTFSEIGPRVVLIFKFAYLWPAAEFLTRVHLQNNRLKYLDPCFMLAKLTELDVANNQLTELPEEIGALENLRLLDVSNNAIKTLPTSLHRLYNVLSHVVVNGNPLNSSVKNLFSTKPPFAGLYYLQCKAQGIEFDLANAPIPRYLQENRPVTKQVYLTHTPSFDIPLDFFSYKIAPDVTNTIHHRVTVKNCDLKLETSIITAADKAYWTHKYWEKAAGVIVFTNRNEQETNEFLMELKDFLPSGVCIMLVVVVREKDQLASESWEPIEDGLKIVARNKVWVEEYDFSEVRKKLANSGRNAIKTVEIEFTPILPYFRSFENELLADFNPLEHFLGIKAGKAGDQKKGKEETEREGKEKGKEKQKKAGESEPNSNSKGEKENCHIS